MDNTFDITKLTDELLPNSRKQLAMASAQQAFSIIADSYDQIYAAPDRKSKAYEKHVKTIVSRAMDQAKDELRHDDVAFLFEGKIASRRKTAIERFITDIFGTLSKDESDFPPLERNVADFFAAYPVLDVSSHFVICSMFTAAAIYILDNLTHYGKMDEAMQYFRFDDEALSRTDLLPEGFNDSVHDIRLVTSLVYLMVFRETTEHFGPGEFPSVTQIAYSSIKYRGDTYDLSPPSDVLSNRKRLDSILSLITNELDYRKEETNELFNKIIGNVVSSMRFIYEKKQGVDKQIKSFVENSLNIAQNNVNISGAIELLDQHVMYQNLSTYVLEYIATCGANKATLHAYIEDQRKKRGTAVYKEISQMAKYLITTVPISDPYFAMYFIFLLMDIGNDMYWLLTPAFTIILRTINNLPWANYSPDITKPYVPEYDRDLYDADENYRSALFETVFPNIFSEDTPDELISLAQIIYSEAGFLLPRSTYGVDPDILDKLEDLDLTDSEKILIECLLEIGYQNLHRTRISPEMILGTKTIDRPVDTEKEPDCLIPQTAEDEQKENTQQDALIEKLRAENKNLRELWYDLDSENRMLKAKVQEQSQEYSSLKQEVVSLRELAYAYGNENSTDAEDTDATGVSLPCPVSARIVIFGGQDSWVNAMKEFIPGATYISKEIAKIDINIIRNAEVVWIQTNALHHRQYFTIINEVRRNNKPVEYFAYSSAEKCAMQLAVKTQKK